MVQRVRYTSDIEAALVSQSIDGRRGIETLIASSDCFGVGSQPPNDVALSRLTTIDCRPVGASRQPLGRVGALPFVSFSRMDALPNFPEVVRDTLNIMSLIGVMMLMGIVGKNAILLIDF